MSDAAFEGFACQAHGRAMLLCRDVLADGFPSYGQVMEVQMRMKGRSAASAPRVYLWTIAHAKKYEIGMSRMHWSVYRCDGTCVHV